jgi:hypothetical protein
MILLPNTHQYLFRKNPSRLHSLWLALWLSVRLFVVWIVIRGCILSPLMLLSGWLMGMFKVLTGIFEVFGYGLFGYLDAERMTPEEFNLTHQTRIQAQEARRASSKV